MEVHKLVSWDDLQKGMYSQIESIVVPGILSGSLIEKMGEGVQMSIRRPDQGYAALLEGQPQIIVTMKGVAENPQSLRSLQQACHANSHVSVYGIFTYNSKRDTSLIGTIDATQIYLDS